jgi:serine/threonine protein kinase
LFEEFQRLSRYLRAPELLDSVKNYNESVDIWSLGCIIFNMVTGIPPFYDSDEN